MSKAWPKWVRCAWILPVGELLLALVVAGLPAWRVLEEIRTHPLHTKRPEGGDLTSQIPSGQIEIWLSNEKKPQFPNRFEAISFLNFPGVFGGILIDRFTTWPSEWQPRWSQPLGNVVLACDQLATPKPAVLVACWTWHRRVRYFVSCWRSSDYSLV